MPRITAPIQPTKPGYKTSEFWLTAVAFALTLALSSGAIPTESAAHSIVTQAGTLLAALGYTFARTKAKA